jgi:hypothetical protein
VDGTEMKSNDLNFSREITVEAANDAEQQGRSIFAVCVKTDDEKLLVPMKIYQIESRGENILVKDEEGEPAVYPADFFMYLKLAPALETLLLKVPNNR